ncbi:ethanolamine utilization protein EutN [candidate division KSB3 bacterium]|uniref:Ethanolamine utilization protein EutN n=1 Tax=candidate division KSB3 bacterium TaxID=2044937 RepID=A0A2G6E398_9BACT|nr:MAG: ethanolamine utilization protein EutN [candidate division KSB3 bacterium]PIE29039.1 MAG: ethanolamine utilization protein EutN [candidate division KSB3 bacterium]
MKLGKVIGRVVCSKHLEELEGLTLLLVQTLDETQRAVGTPLVAFDTVQAGEGDLVFYETSKEAGRALREWFTPADAAVIGLVDHMTLEDSQT